MARFGLFTSTCTDPDQEFEGDYLVQNGECVAIFKRPSREGVAAEQVAAIRLAKSQAVRKIG